MNSTLCIPFGMFDLMVGINSLIVEQKTSDPNKMRGVGVIETNAASKSFFWNVFIPFWLFNLVIPFDWLVFIRVQGWIALFVTFFMPCFYSLWVLDPVTTGILSFPDCQNSGLFMSVTYGWSWLIGSLTWERNQQVFSSLFVLECFHSFWKFHLLCSWFLKEQCWRSNIWSKKGLIKGVFE